MKLYYFLSEKSSYDHRWFHDSRKCTWNALIKLKGRRKDRGNKGNTERRHAKQKIKRKIKMKSRKERKDAREK
jgi:hypothetical protein